MKEATGAAAAAEAAVEVALEEAGWAVGATVVVALGAEALEVAAAGIVVDPYYPCDSRLFARSSRRTCITIHYSIVQPVCVVFRQSRHTDRSEFTPH